MQVTEYVRSLSVVVPLLNERTNLEALVDHLASLNAEQLIIVDGGSDDGSAEWLASHWHDSEKARLLIRTTAGRARQMNAGAAYAQGDILLFLHADSRLPHGAKREVIQSRENQNLWGRFDISFAMSSSNASTIMMNIIAFFMNIRSRLSSIATGDQAMFMDTILFRTINGFPDQPLMEDVAMSKILKRHSVPHCSYLKVQTSPRRWEKNGVLKTVLTMWYFRLAYFFGVSPQRLAHKYQNIR